VFRSGIENPADALPQIVGFDGEVDGGHPDVLLADLEGLRRLRGSSDRNLDEPGKSVLTGVEARPSAGQRPEETEAAR
jgi:hypothetical protein